MKASRFIRIVVLILFLGTTACNLPSNQSVTPSAYTAAALTVTALAGTAQAIQQLPTATSTATPLPTNTVPVQPVVTSVVASSTPGGTYFVVDVGANCRTGPGTIYDKVTSFTQGTYVSLVGHNADNSWWYVLVGNTNCWISGSTGHTTGPLNNLPLISVPPTPTVAATATGAAGPTLSDPTALMSELSYPSNCTSNSIQVAIRVADAGNGINSVWLSYRYTSDNGYVGNWHTVSPNNNASGGINGFDYPIGTEAAGELGTQNGTFQYQFFAKDNSGNTSSYPSVLTLHFKNLIEPIGNKFAQQTSLLGNEF